jgi:hypothetical protein
LSFLSLKIINDHGIRTNRHWTTHVRSTLSYSTRPYDD